MKNEKFLNVTLNDKEIECFEVEIKKINQPFGIFRNNDRLYLNFYDGKGSFIRLDKFNDLFKFITNGTTIEKSDLWDLYEKSVTLKAKIRNEDAQIGNKKIENLTLNERELKFFEDCLSESLYNCQKDIICLAKHDNFMYEVNGSKEKRIGFCPNEFNFIDEKGTEFNVSALLECYEKSDLFWTELNRKNAIGKVKLTDDEMRFVEVLLNIFDEESNIWIDRTIYGDLTISEDCIENEWGSIYIPKCNNLFSFLGHDKPIFSINLQELIELYENQSKKVDENKSNYEKIHKKCANCSCDKNSEPKKAESDCVNFTSLKSKAEELKSKANEWVELWQLYNKDTKNSSEIGLLLQDSFKDLNFELEMLYNLAASLSFFNFISDSQLISICNSIDEIDLILSDFDYVNDLFF